MRAQSKRSGSTARAGALAARLGTQRHGEPAEIRYLHFSMRNGQPTARTERIKATPLETETAGRPSPALAW